MLKSKTKNKPLSLVMTIAGAVFLVGLPFLVAAEGPANTPQTKRAEAVKVKLEERQATLQAQAADRQANRQEKFCERFTETAGNISERFEERQATVVERITRRENNWAERKDMRDDRLAEVRAGQDARRAELYAKLEAKAATDTEKAAVLTFKKAIDQAVSVRRAAVDAAMQTFRDGVQQALASRGTITQDAISDFRSAVDTAVTQARSQCEGKVDPSTVRSTFRSALQAARVKLQDERGNQEQVGQKVRELAQVRQDAFAQALADFKKAAEKARTDLKTTLGETKTPE